LRTLTRVLAKNGNLGLRQVCSGGSTRKALTENQISLSSSWAWTTTVTRVEGSELDASSPPRADDDRFRLRLGIAPSLKEWTEKPRQRNWILPCRKAAAAGDWGGGTGYCQKQKLLHDRKNVAKQCFAIKGALSTATDQKMSIYGKEPIRETSEKEKLGHKGKSR